MPAVKINFDIHPLPDQELVFNSKSKLNSVASTRRSGKTSGIKLYGILRALQGREQAIVMPDYQSYCREMFDDFCDVGQNCWSQKSSSSLTLRTLTGGRIRFFSYEAINKMRGKKFHDVYFDEFQSYSGNINDLKAILLPTLADYHGSAWFFGTPKKYTPIEEITKEKDALWSHFKMKAINNPFISEEEIEQQKRLLPPLVFAQEWLAEFVDFSGVMWLYEFKPEIHLQPGLEIEQNERIYLSFDFNVDPCTCELSQKIDKPAHLGGGINFIKEFSIVGGTQKLCLEVKKYLDLQKAKGFKSTIWVTGDNSGTKSDTRGNTTDYEIIRDILQIPFAFFIDTRKANPRLSQSRDICNLAFYHNLVYIDPDGCPILAADCQKARPKEGSDELVKDRNGNECDAFDCARYQLNAFFKVANDIFSFSRVVNGS